jgi:hypothetical protein
MNESLLREIIIRVLADPRFQPLLAAGQPAAAGRNALIVVENSEGLQAVESLQRRHGLEYSLHLCVAGPLAAPDAALPQVAFDKAMAAAWERILVPCCTGRQLAAIATGVCLDKISELVGWAVLQGIPVAIGRIDYGFTAKTPAAYKTLLTDYARQVAAYGVAVGDEAPAAPPAPVAVPPSPDNAMPWTSGERVGAAAPKAPDMRPTIPYDGKLLAEKDAILLPKHAVLLLARPTVLTPSALDILKQRKIEVYREGVRFL